MKRNKAIVMLNCKGKSLVLTCLIEKSKNVGEISEEIKFVQPATSSVLRRLLKQKLINVKDGIGRSRIYSLTSHGRKIAMVLNELKKL